MSRILSSLVAAAIVMGAVAAPPPVVAASNPNVMIMGRDADRDSVPCDSRVFKAVLDRVANQLNQEGFNIFDETAATLANFEQGRCRRPDAELIDILRTVKRPPLDVAVLLAMYAGAEMRTYTAKVRVRISGRLLNVKTGQDLGSFEVEAPDDWNMRVDCARRRNCLLEGLVKFAGILANDLGSVLALKLDALTKTGAPAVAGASAGGGGCLPNAYTFIFNGYTSDDMKLAEEYIVAFSDYRKHRPSHISPRRREYWYESCIEPGRLTRNFNEMFRYMNTPSTVNFAQARNTFTLKKITLRKQR